MHTEVQVITGSYRRHTDGEVTQQLHILSGLDQVGQGHREQTVVLADQETQTGARVGSGAQAVVVTGWKTERRAERIAELASPDNWPALLLKKSLAAFAS